MSESPAADDARLAEAARSGDRVAFASLIALHKATLYRLARGFVGNGDDAYDILQETFVSAWLSLARFDTRQCFGPWIRTILLNKCRDHSRRRTVRRKLLQWLQFTEPDPDASPTGDAHAAEGDEARLSALEQAIADLPARYKEALLLTAYQGMSHREAAAQLGLTPKAVELRIHRARKRLEAQVQRDDA